VLLAAAAIAAAATAASIAFATTTAKPLGSGVVVIDTSLGLQGGEAAGTGMVLTSNGEILTNNHVIRGATTVKIVLPGTRRSYTARVLGYDVTDDVAILKANGASNLKTVSLGNSATVKLRQTVRAVGNAGGTGTLTSSTGKVTGLSRSITVTDETGNAVRLAGLIETSAGLQPGDSGGPLLNASGKVVGMDAAASFSSGFQFQQTASNDGYAIPINRAIAIEKLIEAGKATATVHVGGTAFLGVQLSGNGPADNVTGAVIAAVVDGSPAAKAGLAAGDVITAVDGKSVLSATGLTKVIVTRKPGEKVALTYLDGTTGQSSTAQVTLASGPPQ
jgi:S1-C subfamily serine protease